MGLDSIELLMAYEDYFQVHIPDLEIEKAVTVGDFLDLLIRHNGLAEEETTHLAKMRHKVNLALLAAGLVGSPLGQADFVLVKAGLDQPENWQKFTDSMGMVVPKPANWADRSANWWQKLVHEVGLSVNYSWRKVTFDQFVTSIHAANLDLKANGIGLNSRFEILAAITAITVDQIGVDFYEVQLDKSFANDFGIG